MDLVRVAVLAEQYTLNAEYSCCGKAYLLGQRHYALYWNIGFFTSKSHVLQRKLLTHTLSEFGVLCEAVGVFPAMRKVKWR